MSLISAKSQFSIQGFLKLCFYSLCLALACLNSLGQAASTNLTWTGLAGDFNWQNANNWGGVSFPADQTFSAIFPNGTGDITVNNVPQNINQITTNNGKITLVPASGSITVRQQSTAPTTNGIINIGSGGLQINGSVRFENGSSQLNAGGNFKATGLSWGNQGTITQTAGAFDVTSFSLPISTSNFPISNWVFAGTSANTIAAGSTTPSFSYKMLGTPTTVGTTRLNYNVTGGGEGIKWDLNGQTMIANQIDVQGSGTPFTRYGYLSDTLGGTIDANNFVIATGNYAAAFINLHNTNVTLRGSGTIYDNRSQNNNASAINIAITNGGIVTPVQKFDITDNTTFTFNPTGGTANVDTGSTDLGLSGFTDNFAFHNVTIATGDTITLTGNQNVGGSANNALYVGGTLRGENNATLNLNTRNAYVNGGLEIGNSPGKFTVQNGNLNFTSNATVHFEVNGTTAGTEYDQLVFSGTGTISLNNAMLDLDINALAPGIYTLINNQTSNLINGTFAGLVDGATFVTGNPQYGASITYFGNAALGTMSGGNDFMLQITFVPEPSSALLLGLGLVGFRQLRRRKRS